MNKNNYKNFVDSMSRASENDYINCRSLICVSVDYATYLKWYKKLYSLERRINIYLNNSDNYKILEYNYIILKCYEYIREEYEVDNTFEEFLEIYVFSDDWYSKLNDSYLLFEEYPELDNEKYSETIIQALKNYNKYFCDNIDYKLGYFNLKIERLKIIIENVLNNLEPIIVGEEEAFNMIYSEDFINEMINIMENKSYPICLRLAPARRSLTIGEMKHNRKNYDFTKSFNYNLEELKAKCREKLTNYKTLISNTQGIDKWFASLSNK